MQWQIDNREGHRLPMWETRKVGSESTSRSRSHGLHRDREPRHGRQLVGSEAHLGTETWSIGPKVIMVAEQGAHRLIVVCQLELVQEAFGRAAKGSGRASLRRRREANVDLGRSVRVGNALRRTHSKRIGLDRLYEVGACWHRIAVLQVTWQAMWHPARRSGSAIGSRHRRGREER